MTTGKVMTTGDNAFGIIAQSIGGGGGLIGGGVFVNTLSTNGPFAGSAGGVGSAGTVMVNAQADVMVTGAGSTAIYAQSATAAGTGGNIGVTLGNATTGTAQTVSGGSNGATTTNAVTFAGGAANTLSNYALLTTSSGIAGTTITGGVGSEAVTSFGHMIGSIDLGSGVNSIDNKQYNTNPSTSAGVFDSGTTINVGAGNLFTNEGLISPGAFLNVLTSNETGNYLQSTTGSCGTFGAPTSTCGYFGTDLDLKNILADRLNVTEHANVTGAVVVNIDNPGYATPGTNTLTLISAALGETHSNLTLQAFQTAVATYGLTFPNTTDIDLQYTIDFSPSGLTQNQHSVGNAINAIQTAHVPAFVPIAAALFYQPTVAALGAVYDSLSGEGIAATEQTAIAANDLFHTSILNEARFWLFDNESNDANSVSVYGDAPMGYAEARKNNFPAYASAAKAPAPAQRTWRMWTTFNGGNWNYSGDHLAGSANTSANGAGFASGLDYQVNPNLIVGMAAGYGKAWVAIPGRSTNDSVEGTHLAAYTAARNKDSYAMATLGFDYFTNHEARFASIPGTILPPLFGMQIPPIPGFAENLIGQFASYSVSGQFEVGHKYHLNAFDVTPLAGVQFTSLWMNGFTETRSSGLPSTIGLSLPGRNIASVPGYLGMQLDSKQYFGNGTSFDGWMRAEWVHEFEPHRTIDPAFIAAPGFGFIIEGAQAAPDMARLSMGGKLNLTPNLSLTGNVRADLYRTPSFTGWGGLRVAW